MNAGEEIEGIDATDMAQALNEDLAHNESVSGILQHMQEEIEKLKLENTFLKQDLSRYKPRGSQWNTAFTPLFKTSSETGARAKHTTFPPPVEVTVNVPNAVPLAAPERFHGDSNKFHVFINQCQLHFVCKPQQFPTDATKVAFVLSYLGGTAANWSIPFVDRDDPILHNWNQFKRTMTSLFAKHTFMQASDNELLNLKQGNKDLLTYLTSFNRLLTETRWPEEKRVSLFYKGLRDELKDALAHIVDLPEDYSDFVDLVVKLEHRLGERKGDKSKLESRLTFIRHEKKDTDNKLPEPEPMQIGTLRGPLTSEEKERRRKLQLCLYCGKAGHFARECPVKPKTSRKGTVSSISSTESGND